MKLIHFSAEPLTEIRSANQYNNPDFKPRGLWVSVDSAWAEWCESEDFRTQALDYRTEIVLSDDANILYLRSAEDIDKFTDEYGWDLLSGSPTILWIDWERVARKYQGIIINPYIYSRRLDMRASWYYGWDCASGCIWDKKAIKEIRYMVVEEV